VKFEAGGCGFLEFPFYILSWWMRMFDVFFVEFPSQKNVWNMFEVGEKDLSYSHLFSAARSFSPVATTRSTKHACKCHSLWELS